MSNRKQFVTINGTKHYLTSAGSARLGSDVWLTKHVIAALDLEVEAEGPSFEDIEPGIYSPHANIHNVIFKKKEGGYWTNAEGCPLDDYTAEKLIEWHEEGVLYRLNKGEATSA